MKLCPAIFLAVGVLTLFSCEKEPYNASGTFYGTRISSMQTKLYTKAGEVEDPAVVERFVAAHGDFEPNMDIYLSTYKYKATYLDPTTVVVNALEKGTVKTMSVIDRDSVVIWEDRDTVRQYSQHIEAFKYKRVHYTEVMDEDSNRMITNYLNCSFLRPSGPDLLMPIMFYYHKKGAIGSISERTGKGNNEFNLDYLKGLGNTDTILVYQYTLRLEAQ